MKYIFTLFICVLLTGIALGQCSQIAKSVKTAERLFDEGDLEKAATELKAVLNRKDIPYCGVESLRAQLLLTEIALFMNQDSLAKVAFKTALSISPRYKVDTTLKSMDLYYFSKNYRTVPKFSYRPYVGVNNYPFKNRNYFPTPSPSNRYNINIDDTSASIRTADLGYNVGISVSWHPTTFLEIALGGDYGIKNIDIEKPIGVKTLLLRENQTWVNVPILTKIALGTQSVIAKGFAGVEYSYLINATLSEPSNGNISTDDNEVNINDLRNKHHYSYLLGVGFDVRPSKLTKNYLSIELKYSNQRTAMVNAEKRYSNLVTLFGLGYVDDDIPIGVHHLELSIGLSLTQYRVQEIKRQWDNIRKNQ
jgi:hypothetical protein